jgi:D-alanyl-D-alanine carboxypeptidase
MESITGYKYEPWHLRYVGPEIAAEVYESGITYDEYYVRVLEPEMRAENQTP